MSQTEPEAEYGLEFDPYEPYEGDEHKFFFWVYIFAFHQLIANQSEVLDTEEKVDEYMSSVMSEVDTRGKMEALVGLKNLEITTEMIINSTIALIDFYSENEVEGKYSDAYNNLPFILQKELMGRVMGFILYWAKDPSLVVLPNIEEQG